MKPGFFTSQLRNRCFDPSRYLEGDSLYSQASLIMSDTVTYQDTLRHVASAEDVAEVIVKKLCRRADPLHAFSGMGLQVGWISVQMFDAKSHAHSAPCLLRTQQKVVSPGYIAYDIKIILMYMPPIQLPMISKTHPPL
ncbi:TPA: hypothetical protein ACH3X1_002765 [Trebouxia sp. C0004]